MPPLDGTNDTIDVQNGLNDKGTGNTGKRQLAEYHDDKMDRNSYGGDSDYYENDEYGYGGNSDYYENGGFDGRPQSPRFVGRPQGQGGFVGRPQRSENYGDDYNEQYEYEIEGVDESNLDGPQSLGLGGSGGSQTQTKANQAIARIGDFKNKTPEYWKKHLKPEVYRICRESGTEPAGSGQYDKFTGKGTYYCNCCGGDFPLFSSDAKYDSGTGWPSFWEPISNLSVTLRPEKIPDTRIEVVCSRCGGHLGHVFNDGPADKTGKRFCMNSLALHFVPQLGEVKNLFSTLK